MKKCNCICSIIPPHIIDELSKKGNLQIVKEALAPGINLHDAIRNRRTARQQGITENRTLLAAVVTGSAQRKVYDCQHTTALKSHLIRSEGNVPVADDIVNAVYDNTGIVREFYENQYNYNSVDNHGTDLILNVHYSNKFNNAFWDGSEMIFGDGDGVIFVNFGNALDVTGHELTHGVVQNTAALVYDSQSGALNEHMADVFGIAIKQLDKGQTSAPDTANWLIGDTIIGPTLSGQAVRSLKAPGTAYNNNLLGKDPQPDHMSNYYNGASDNHGVHINSGIPNKVFYLASVGLGDTLKAALLWFETLKTLKPNDTFAIFKTKLLAQATALSAANKIPANAYTVANNAFTTVGL